MSRIEYVINKHLALHIYWIKTSWCFI